jgi:stage V sporulation protein S
MDRFFSKLDLRDIKIDPEAKFPPDEESYTETEPVQSDWNGGVEAYGAVVTESPVVTEVQHRNGEVLKVSARSRPSAVAGAIAGVVREFGRAEVQAIGAGATNQAVKAVAIARDYLLETGIEAVCLPAFIDVTIDNEDRTAIRLLVEPR